MRLSILHEGWEEDFGLSAKDFPASKTNIHRVWEQFFNHFKKGFLTPQEFAQQAISGIISGKFDQSRWYDLGGYFDIPNTEMEEIYGLGCAEELPAQDKLQRIMTILQPYFPRRV